MDLSVYYEEFQSTYNIAVFALCLAAFAVIFVGVRSIKDKRESTRIKMFNGVLLCLIFASVLTYFMLGPRLAKKDIEQKTIYGYEGALEIVEISHGIYHKAVFSFENEEITLKYYPDETECDEIRPGKYEGRLVYAEHLAQVLYFEIYQP